MPGGKGNITHADSVPFSSTNQPKNRRKSTKFLTELLTKGLQGKAEIVIEGIDTETGKKTKIRVPMPTKNQIVQALLRKAAKGDTIAIKEVFDRIEGRVRQPIGFTDSEGQDIFSNKTDDELRTMLTASTSKLDDK